MSVFGSSERESVSTPITCDDLLFQGPYLRQLAVLTSSQVYSNSCNDEKIFIFDVFRRRRKVVMAAAAVRDDGRQNRSALRRRVVTDYFR